MEKRAVILVSRVLREARVRSTVRPYGKNTGGSKTSSHLGKSKQKVAPCTRALIYVLCGNLIILIGKAENSHSACSLACVSGWAWLLVWNRVCPHGGTAPGSLARGSARELPGVNTPQVCIPTRTRSPGATGCSWRADIVSLHPPALGKMFCRILAQTRGNEDFITGGGFRV